MCKKWLRRYILEHKSWCIPFHLPSGSIRESAHSSFHQLLCNHKKFQPVCRCVQIRKQFSGLPTTGGHVFASAEQIAAQIPGDLGIHLLYNSRTPVFPNQEQYFQKTAAVHSLVKVTRAPPPLGFGIPCFCQFALAIAPGTCRADSTPRRL